MKVKELRNWFESGDKKHQGRYHRFSHKNEGGTGNKVDYDDNYPIGIESQPSTISTSPSSYVASPVTSFEYDDLDDDEDNEVSSFLPFTSSLRDKDRGNTTAGECDKIDNGTQQGQVDEIGRAHV